MATVKSVQEFDHADGRPNDDNRPAQRPGINMLRESMRKYGQLVPGLVCSDPEDPDRYIVLDGVGRWSICGELRIPFQAIMQADPVPEADQIRLDLQHNTIRRNLTTGEVADKTKRFIEVLDCTQEEASRELSLSTATVSRAMTVNRRLPAHLKELAEAVRPSIVAMIATLPSHDDMRRSLVYATTPGRDGKLPTREQVGFFIEQFKVKKTRGAKVKPLKGVVDGRRVELGLLPDESTDSVIEFLQALTAKIRVYRKLPPENLDFLFNGQGSATPGTTGEPDANRNRALEAQQRSG